MYAEYTVKMDNPFMNGDQSQTANYAPAIVAAALGAVLLIVGAIYSSRRD